MKTISIALGALMLAGAAQAGPVIDEIVRDLKAQGYTYIELKAGPRQVKAEAQRGGEQLEAYYDSATGVLIRSEVERDEDGEMARNGVEYAGSNHDDDGHEDGHESGDDDHDEDDHDSDDHDDDDGGDDDGDSGDDHDGDEDDD